MNDKINGLVLKISDYKDNDELLQVLTDNYGVISLIAKSSKKITSKHHFFVSCTYEFIIDYKDNKTIYSIHGSKLIKNYYDLDNTKLLAFKNILFELSLKNKEELNNESYLNLIFTLDNINDNNKYLLGSLYVSYVSRLLGLTSNVDECVVCRSKKVVGISNRLGGFLCKEHITGESVQDINTLKKFRLIFKAKYKDYELIKDNEYTLNDFKLILDFLLFNASINLKTYEFYKSLF